MHDIIPLNCLAAGAAGEIAEVVGRAEQVHRLHEMGLRGGVRIEVLQGGSPCIVRVGGHRLCFRDCETMGVLVRPSETPAPEATPQVATANSVSY
jgi:ferrous iron transport protein A